MRLRLIHLKKSVNFFSYQSLKRIVDFAIFLTVFALISSAISIFYEIKVNDLSLKISQDQTKQRIYNSWITLISENLHKSERRFIFTAENMGTEWNNFSDELNRDQVFTFRIYQILNQMPTQLKNAARDMKYNFSNKQIEKYDIESLEEGYEKAYVLLRDTDYFNTKNNFSELQQNLVKSIFETEQLLKKALSIFLSAKSDVDQSINNLSEQKNEISRLSTNIILISFVLQLLIFLAIQFVDIRSSEEV